LDDLNLIFFQISSPGGKKWQNLLTMW